MSNPKIMLGLSGGLDSAVLLAFSLHREFVPVCCTFNYGSTHGEYEQEQARQIIAYYRRLGHMIYHHEIDLSGVMSTFSSGLLASSPAIANGAFNEAAIKQMVVPGRNLIFASIMAGLAESLKVPTISLAVHSDDVATYPDCRPAFIAALRDVIAASTDHGVNVICPFVGKTKERIVRLGASLDVPFHLTRSCYAPQESPCGKCSVCVSRIAAFKEVGIVDPLVYAK